MQHDTFATRLRAMMTEQGITKQADLCRLLSAELGRKIAAQTVSSWLAGINGCRGSDLPALIKVLGLRPTSKAAADLYRLSAKAAQDYTANAAGREAEPVTA